MDYTALNQEANYPDEACEECLTNAGGRLIVATSTVTQGVCPVCGVKAMLSTCADYGYPCFKPKPAGGRLCIGTLYTEMQGKNDLIKARK